MKGPPEGPDLLKRTGVGEEEGSRGGGMAMQAGKAQGLFEWRC